MLRAITLGILATFFAATSPGQVAIAGAGYLPLAPVPVAPGQLLTFFVNLDISAGLANSVPLPPSIGGTSVEISRKFGPNAGVVVNAPLLGISAAPIFLFRTSGLALAEITIQVPYEVQSGSDLIQNIYSLAILAPGANANGSALIQLVAQPDAIHIIRTGDTLTTPNYGLHPVVGPFPPAITHADGSPVTPGNPAKVGESIVIWAVGLGRPATGAVATGAANPSPPLTTTVNVDFEFRPNAGPSMPWYSPGSSTSTSPGDSHVPAISVPAYFAPGYVGLYQVNVTIPTPPVPLESCGGIFQSNVTVNVGGIAPMTGPGFASA